MLIEHIERVRRGSYEKRRRYAFMVSMSVTGIIVAVWITTLIGAHTYNEDAPAPEPDPEQTETASLQQLKEQFRSANTFGEDAATHSLLDAQPSMFTAPSDFDAFDMPSDDRAIGIPSATSTETATGTGRIAPSLVPPGPSGTSTQQ